MFIQAKGIIKGDELY